MCGHFDADIISLDLGTRLPFRIKHGPVNLAITRGLFFEIRYAPAIRDQNSRKNLISNAMALAKVTKGKNIIFTSEASTALELRGPHDIINMYDSPFLRDSLCTSLLLDLTFFDLY